MTRTRWVLLWLAVILGGVAASYVSWVFGRIHERAFMAEAGPNLRALFDASVVYYTDEYCAGGAKCTGAPGEQPLPRQFPQTVGLTPSGPFCRDGEPVTGPFDAAAWDHPTWKALGFAPKGPLVFRYEYRSSGVGEDAVVAMRAVSDHDCDGVVTVIGRGESVNDSALGLAGPRGSTWALWGWARER